MVRRPLPNPSVRPLTIMAVQTLNVNGVEVEFPFQPYPCQLTYMGKVVQALQEVYA